MSARTNLPGEEKPRIPDEVLATQTLASDPKHSVWVSANAGSGKTHVLSQRVIRLLLNGTDPSKILCLTYTKAAAANMSNRVFGQLSKWATLSDRDLRAAIREIEGDKRNDRTGILKLKRARQLFARALETPGGLKIQTIHAFCEAILQQFPLEANIAGHFELLDTVMQDALIAEARRDMIAGVGLAGDQPLAEAFDTVLARGRESGLDQLLAEIVTRRDDLRLLFNQKPSEAVGPLLRDEFGFRPGETAATIASGAWPLPGFGPAEFPDIVSAAESARAKVFLRDLVPDAVAAFETSDPEARLRLLRKAFLTGKGEPYSDKMFTTALLAHYPDLAERYAGAAEHIIKTADRAALFSALKDTEAAMIIAERMIGRYERLKSARGFLDFNDLINRTVRLLSRGDVGPWIHYRLDQGIDHILLDEAQDTSPEQWAVVRKLAEEFFSGMGARDGVKRTVFAVGDEKQSIYSFQGADPAGFNDNRQAFKASADSAGAGFQSVKLTSSFRSTQDVLFAVDAVFDPEPMRRSLSSEPLQVVHKAIRDNHPGSVEVWPSFGDTTAAEPEDWRASVDHAKASAAVLAERIASTVNSWLTNGERMPGRGRLVRAGDVLVLVRKRDRFIHALSRSLKARFIPVAGADRLSLRNHIAVQDLMALGRFCVQPEDDLSLAAVLRSPIFGVDEDELLRIATRARGQSLYSNLRTIARQDAPAAEIVSRLERWQNEAVFLPVFEFYSAVLGRDHVRKRMIARLGQDAGDMLDEFLAFCFAEAKTGRPGLDAFLATLDVAAPEIRREMDQGRNEVRIMTVHAAKGLEAPIVFLVDSGAPAFNHTHMPRLVPFRSRKGLWQGDAFLWRAATDTRNAAVDVIRDEIQRKAEDEYWRLLYVGLTRAEDRLVVCGYHGQRTPKGTWLERVHGALSGSPFSHERRDPILGKSVLHYRVSAKAMQNELLLAQPEAEIRYVEPDWLTRKLPPPPELPRPLAPSGAAAVIDPQRSDRNSHGGSPVFDAVDEATLSIRRGNAVHRLLQVLPAIGFDERAVAMERYLRRVGADWSPAERAAAARSVEKILADPAFAPIFAPSSRAEVAVMGHLTVRGVERSITGKIDRLAITDRSVLIVDYKTNRPPPASFGEVPESHLVQLALYRALLQPLYPELPVQAALLYTEAPRLIPLPADRLDEALQHLVGVQRR